MGDPRRVAPKAGQRERIFACVARRKNAPFIPGTFADSRGRAGRAGDRFVARQAANPARPAPITVTTLQRRYQSPARVVLHCNRGRASSRSFPPRSARASASPFRFAAFARALAFGPRRVIPCRSPARDPRITTQGNHTRQANARRARSCRALKIPSDGMLSPTENERSASDDRGERSRKR